MSTTKDQILNALNTYTPLVRENFKKTFPAADKISIKGGTFKFNSDTGVANISIPSAESIDTSTFVTAVSIQGAGSASIDSGTLNISIPSAESIDTSTFVTAVSIQGAGSASIDSGTLNISIPSAESIDTSTFVTAVSIQGAGSASIDSGTLNISIPAATAGNFTVNGAVAKAMSVTGAASVSVASDTALVSIQSAAAEKVTINNALSNNISIDGAAVIAYDTQTSMTTVTIADRKPKASADFELVPAAVTLNAWQPATITANHLGDGSVGTYSDRFISSEQIDATSFRVIGKYEGSRNIGFWLSETEKYYPAAKNVSVTVTDDKTMPLLMHFDDLTKPFRNDGWASFTIDPNEAPGWLSDGGKFGKCLNALSSTVTFTSEEFLLGGKDFTIDFWHKSNLNWIKIDNVFANNLPIQLVNINQNNLYSIFLPTRHDSQVAITSEWTHLAVVYQHDLGVIKCFINGDLVASEEVTVTRKNVSTITIDDAYLDELHILDGVALWTGNFTPPTEPF